MEFKKWSVVSKSLSEVLNNVQKLYLALDSKTTRCNNDGEVTIPCWRSINICSMKPDSGAWTRDGFNTRWRKSRDEAKKTSGLPMDFTFHDLKAKGISDLDGTLQEKQAISGHKPAGQTARYDRKTKIVDSVEGHKK